MVQVVCGFSLHLLYWLSLHGNLSPAGLFEVKALWIVLFENLYLRMNVGFCSDMKSLRLVLLFGCVRFRLMKKGKSPA